MTFRASSPEACTGSGGAYQLWVHHLFGGKLRFSTFQLQAGPDEIEGLLAEKESADIHPAQAVVLALREFPPNGNTLDLRQGDIATTALLRFCAAHGSRTRMEVARRHAWLPVGTTHPSILKLSGLEIDLDDRDGMGQIRRKAPDGKKYWCPIGSMPVTGREELATTTSLVQVGPNRHAAQGVYAAVHRYPDETLAEGLYMPQQDEVLFRMAQPQSLRPRLSLVASAEL
jgi:hypothetical protein